MFKMNFSLLLINLLWSASMVEGADICQNGKLQLDTEKYYTIRWSNNYWAALTAGQPIEFTSDKSRRDAHWRFVEADGGEYTIR